MPKALPYYPMYVNDFDEDPDVIDMTLAEVGLYILCMNESWKRGCIPAEIEKIAIRIRRPISDVHDAWPGISKCWVPSNGDPSKLVNPRQELERNKAETISGVRSYVAKVAHQNRSTNASALVGANAEQLNTNESVSVSKSSSKILSKKEDDVNPQVKWRIFQTRIKKAGVEFNFRYSEKKQAQEWLSGCEEPFDDILAALQVFADDEFWIAQGHPWNAWPKQFDQFLETARAVAPRDAQRAADHPKVATQPEPVAGPPGPVQALNRDLLAEWNVAVPDAETERDSRNRNLDEITPEFIAKFEKVCEVARGFRKNKPDSTWLTFYWLLATKEGHSRPNWKRLITDMRGMAMPASPESGQADDDGPWFRERKVRKGKYFSADMAKMMAWQRAKDDAEEAAGA